MKRFFVAGLITIVGLFGLVAIFPTTVDAVSPCPSTSAFLGFPNWYRGLDCEGDTDAGTYHVIVGGETAIPRFIWTIVLNALDILLRIAGILAVVMILFSAFKYVTNGGNESKIAAAKTSLMQAVIGLLIAVAAATIVGFVIAGLTGS